MKCVYIGKQYLDYVNKDGKRVQGINLHCTGRSRKVDGTACSVLWVSKTDPLYEEVLKLSYGKLDIDYDSSGTIQELLYLGEPDE